MTLAEAQVGEEYVIKAIDTGDEELDAFLFTLGCYSGELVTVISHLKRACIISVKDGRYAIDRELASVIAI